MNIKREICNSFNAHAKDYENAAKIQLEIGSRLIQRLDYFKIKPKNILDLGCASGSLTKLLKNRYPEANIFGLDLAFAMLKEVTNQNFTNLSLINADLEALPFTNNSFDLVFANQAIHWANSLPLAMDEIKRVMQIDGCLMFSTLGPGSLKEFKAAWAKVDQYAHAHDFIDMHNLGDLLLARGFKDPVVDTENITVQYKTPMHLIRNLKAQGVRNINSKRSRGLTGKKTWEDFKNGLVQSNGKYPLTYEVIYGQAWNAQISNSEQVSEAYISLKQIRENFANIKLNESK